MRGMPAGMGGMPFRSKRASERQSFANSRSPCTTWMATLRLALHPGREVLRGGCRNRGVAVDDFGDHAAQILDAQRERRHVQQQHVLVASDRAARMSACTAAPRATTSSGFSSQCGSRPEQLADQLPHPRNARGAAYQYHFVDLLGA